jgi:lipopolysaccharide biosynthesis regulator YciM
LSNTSKTRPASLERAIALCRQLRDAKSEGDCLTNLGNVFAVRGELRKAVEIYQQSIKC